MKTAQTKVATKTNGIVAAVLPIVSSKAKKVFLKVAKANGQRSSDATTAALKNRQLDNLETELKQFAKTHGDAKVWTSRVAIVKGKRLSKSAQNQVEFWTKQGFKVVNTLAV